jgi:TonB-dependent SusC/RagA subfamily outer membrane receptor
MNCRRIFAGLFLVAFVASFSSFTIANGDPINKIIEQFNKWFSGHPQEKVYLQLDKPYHAIGDDIWFKAYITVGSDHRLSGISGVLNVELIDDKDSVKQSIKLPIVGGITWGDFTLFDSLKEGNYRIRAYTNWMRNVGNEYFFDKTFAIVNAISNNVFTNTTYTYSSQNGEQKVNALIDYTDLNGEPYVGKSVNYQIMLGSKIIVKGKGQTDNKGGVNISFVNSTPELLKSGRIITDLKLGDRKNVRKSVLIKAASAKVDVQFFPEGGNLVNGNNSKIAFKAVGADGLGTETKGVITDDQNKQVTTFNSTHLGMGVFDFIPKNGRTYKAKITYADGSENIVQLPPASNTGYTLSIDDTQSDNINVKIMPGPAVEVNVEQTGVMSLIGQSGGVIYYAGKSKLGSKYFTAVIPKSKFPTGIVQFTLFSATGEPMNERLVFVQNNDQLKLDVSAEKQTFSPREKVKIELNAKNAAGKPVAGSFSVAVTNETKVPIDENAENSILSNLLLTSDLKGYIEKPNYYFTAINEKTQADLDMLMLTQGYHRFEWRQVLSDSFPQVVYRPEKSLEISGRLKTLIGRPVAHGKVTLFTSTGGVFILDTVSDNDGHFSFIDLIFKDSVRFVLQARTDKNHKNIEVDLDNIDLQKIDKNKNAPDLAVNIDEGLSSFLQNSKGWYAGQLKDGLVNHAIMLKDVEIKAKKINPAEHSTNLNGPGNADQVVAGSDIAGLGCAQLGDCLQGRLFGVRFMNGIPYLTGGLKRPMEIVVDGLNVDTDFFNNLNPNDIESIEVLKSISFTSIYGGRGGNGVLVITMKQGGADYSVQRYTPGVITYSPKGYYKARVFYSPQYDDPKTNIQIPDLRTTIYWKPNILTNKEGKASFGFFNADAKGTYRIVVEGIDNEGNLGRQVYRYKVE